MSHGGSIGVQSIRSNLREPNKEGELTRGNRQLLAKEFNEQHGGSHRHLNVGWMLPIYIYNAYMQ